MFSREEGFAENGSTEQEYRYKATFQLYDTKFIQCTCIYYSTRTHKPVPNSALRARAMRRSPVRDSQKGAATRPKRRGHELHDGAVRPGAPPFDGVAGRADGDVPHPTSSSTRERIEHVITRARIRDVPCLHGTDTPNPGLVHACGTRLDWRELVSTCWECDWPRTAGHVQRVTERISVIGGRDRGKEGFRGPQHGMQTVPERRKRGYGQAI
ncbi:hypothetical protein C8R45DRAFT_934183 [Mycena sanguinolenta]|nr:hypothetical protein C8R45DRAFT_934183 [Mycena sanguinolenta]